MDVCHFAEVPFVFHYSPYLAADGIEPALSTTMQTYWTTFARSHKPGDGGDGIAWPQYDAVSDEYLQLDQHLGVITRLKQPQCDWWITVQ